MTDKLEVAHLDHLIQLYQSGVSLKKLSDESGFTRPMLVRRFKQRGIEIRGRSDAERLKWSTLKRDAAAVERQCAAAWNGRRGQVDTLEVKIRRARTRMDRLLNRHRFEDPLAELLRAGGLLVSQQHAVGPYNLDLAISPPGIAVEVTASQMTTERRRAFPKRCEHILNAGWALVIVNVCGHRHGINLPAIADYLVALANRPGWPESFRSQYRVIGRHGKPTTTRGYKLPRWPAIA